MAEPRAGLYVRIDLDLIRRRELKWSLLVICTELAQSLYFSAAFDPYHTRMNCTLDKAAAFDLVADTQSENNN